MVEARAEGKGRADEKRRKRKRESWPSEGEELVKRGKREMGQ